jgi:hypothetical protein
MHHHAKAASAGTIDGSAGRRLWGLIAVLALALCALGSSASSAGAAPASATMGAVEDASYSSVHLTGEVGPTEAEHETSYYFQYSTDGENWSNGPQAFEPGRSVPGGTPGSTSVSENLTGLKGGTKFIVRLAIFDSYEGTEAFSAERPSFKTLPVDPPVSVSADNASELSYTSAKVSGEVERPSGNADPAFDVSCRFEYVSDQQFDESGFEFPGTAECAENPVETQGAPVNVSAELNGLSPNTTYHLRLSAENAGGKITDDAPSTFTTLKPDAPTVSIDPVGSITATSAHFSGDVTPGGTDPVFATSWEFVCQPSCPGEGTSEFIESPDASAHPVSFDPTSLEPNTNYQVELIATNQGGSGTAQTSFQTNPAGPVAETVPAFALGGGTEAVIGGKVNPRNSDTDYWLEYGPGTGSDYPSRIPAGPGASAGSGGQPLFQTQKITGLQPASTYHFRIVAESASGTSEGEDLSFETLPTPTPPPAGCPNDQLRSETSSERLGECRAYEMTSVPSKNGGDALAIGGGNAGGDRMGYYSTVAFAGSKANAGVSAYLAHRTATGWTTSAMQPKMQVPNLASFGTTAIADFADEYSKSITFTRAGVAAEPNALNVFLTDIDGATTLVTSPTVAGLEPGNIPFGEIDDKSYAGRSADASHIVFEAIQPFEPGTSGKQVWEWVGGQVRLVSVLPANQGGGPVVGGAVVGSGVNAIASKNGNFKGTLRQPTAVSADGSRIFFGIGYPAKGVYVRENGSETRQLDLSQRIGSVGEPGEGSFACAAVDGSVVVFTSPNLLTDDATPGGGLYAYDLESDELRFLSAGATDPDGAQLDDVSLVSDDGSHVYFVARGVLVPGEGTSGAHNLYVHGPDGVHFIATLNPDDSQDWNDEFLGGNRITAEATADGQHYVFESYERLTAFDNGVHKEIYRYDSEDDSLTCISCGLQDQAAGGDASTIATPSLRNQFNGFPQLSGLRVILEDGRILFQTTDSLLPADVNAVADVYLYDGGQLSLISSGTSKYVSEFGDITPDGKSIFFTTRDSFVGQDIDGGARDAYVARVDGGFPAPPLPNPCEEEACQGKPGAGPDFSPPATLQPGRGNPRKKPPRKTCKHNQKRKHGKCVPKRGKKHGKKHQQRTSKSGRGK